MIDIHCHLLYDVDDGSDSFDESVRMLRRAAQQGVTKIILTPHYRQGMFPYPKEKILSNLETLKGPAKKEGIELCSGCEYHIDGSVVENMESGRTLTLAGGRYVLAEYSHITEYPFILRTVQELLFGGYTPVIAHAERYPALSDISRVSDLRDMGAMIQINSDAVLGNDGRYAKGYCKKLLGAGLADVIASDSHGIDYRTCTLGECEAYVRKKYGAAEAERLFTGNPERIINNI